MVIDSWVIPFRIGGGPFMAGAGAISTRCRENTTLGGVENMNTTTATDRDTVLSRCKWFADSGHEWLQVPLFLAREADKADKANGGDGISTFSYVKGSFAYLEGDCDAALFLTYFGATDNDAATIHANGVALYTNLAPVRNYPRWRA